MTSRTKWIVVRIVITTLYLLGGWILFTGSLDLDSVLLGASSALLVAVLTYDSFIDESEAAWKSLIPRLHWGIAYLLILLFRLYLSSFQVLFSALFGLYRPRVVHFRTRLRSEIARAAVATSITMTPGTITLELDDDHLIVHWLDATTTHSRQAGKLIKGGFEASLGRIWG
ncbi:MAG: Na+/H+ antiporter subunit E [Alkalispirochaetaceae bacterium]